ncbi:Endonuclease/Exonuclease/phosphatase family protein [compost metagenome]
MKYKIYLLILLSLGSSQLFGQKNKNGRVLKIASYNIQYDNLNDTVNTWNKRLPGVVSVFKKYEFDIVGSQEPYLMQLNGLMPQIPEYTYLGINITGRDGVMRKHYTPIFYKKEKFDVLDWGTFWFSETPNEAGKKGWDAYSPRICTWAKFKDKLSGKQFYFFNVHFDHLGKEARTESAKLLLSEIRNKAKGYPIFVTGDFNTVQNTSDYKILSESGTVGDSYHLTADRRSNATPTYNGYLKYPKGIERIDHIYVSLKPEIKVKNYTILTDSYDGMYPSDHFPILIEAELPR